jgi:hypothetical protein
MMQRDYIEALMNAKGWDWDEMTRRWEHQTEGVGAIKRMRAGDFNDLLANQHGVRGRWCEEFSVIFGIPFGICACLLDNDSRLNSLRPFALEYAVALIEAERKYIGTCEQITARVGPAIIRGGPGPIIVDTGYPTGDRYGERQDFRPRPLEGGRD